jgi:hypothetical protein
LYIIKIFDKIIDKKADAICKQEQAHSKNGGTL